MTETLLQGDCLELLGRVKDHSIDMILADLPYGMTANKWDSVIPLKPLFEQYQRIIKDHGAVLLFGMGKFNHECTKKDAVQIWMDLAKNTASWLPMVAPYAT